MLALKSPRPRSPYVIAEHIHYYGTGATGGKYSSYLNDFSARTSTPRIYITMTSRNIFYIYDVCNRCAPFAPLVRVEGYIIRRRTYMRVRQKRFLFFYKRIHASAGEDTGQECCCRVFSHIYVHTYDRWWTGNGICCKKKIPIK